MGFEDRTELVYIDERRVVIEAHGDRAQRTLMAVACPSDELRQFTQVLNARPFGTSEAHRVWLRFLRQGDGLACGLRISAGGRRREVTLPVCEETYAALEFVFRQFASNTELVPDMPPWVVDVTANPTFQRTATRPLN